MPVEGFAEGNALEDIVLDLWTIMRVRKLKTYKSLQWTTNLIHVKLFIYVVSVR